MDSMPNAGRWEKPSYVLSICSTLCTCCISSPTLGKWGTCPRRAGRYLPQRHRSRCPHVGKVGSLSQQQHLEAPAVASNTGCCRNTSPNVGYRSTVHICHAHRPTSTSLDSPDSDLHLRKAKAHLIPPKSSPHTHAHIHRDTLLLVLHQRRQCHDNCMQHIRESSFHPSTSALCPSSSLLIKLQQATHPSWTASTTRDYDLATAT